MPNHARQTPPGTTPEERRRRDEYLRDLHATFASDTAKRVLRVWRAAYGVDRPRFQFNPVSGNICDPITAAFADGKASVILEIEAHLAESPDATE